MFKTRLSMMVRMALLGLGDGGIVISVGDRVRDRVGKARNGLSDADYSVRVMVGEYMRFNAVGALNVLFFFSLNYLLNLLLEDSPYKSLTVWAPSWLIGAMEAHAVHRRLTFRSRADYRESLMWAYVVYGITAVLSTLSVYLLADRYDINYWIVWAMNTVTFGFATFLGLRYLAFPPSLDAVDQEPEKSGQETQLELWHR